MKRTLKLENLINYSLSFSRDIASYTTSAYPYKTPRKRSKKAVLATLMTIIKPMLGDVTPGPAPTPLPIRVPPKLKAPRVAKKPPLVKKAKPTAKAKGKSLKDTEKENHEHTE